MPAEDAPSAAIDLIRGLYAAVARGDWDGVRACLADDIVVEQSSALPFAGVWRGLDGFGKLGEAIFRAWPDFKVVPVSFMADGDVVLVMTEVSGTHPGSDTPLAQSMIEYWRVVAGKAVACRPYYFDPVAAARSAG